MLFLVVTNLMNKLLTLTEPEIYVEIKLIILVLFDLIQYGKKILPELAR